MTDFFPLEQLHQEQDSWTPVNLNQLPDTPPIEPTLGGTGLLYPGKRHVFSGPPESAKTLAAYAVLIVVAQHAPAVLIDFEMGARDAKKRLQELGATQDALERIHYLEPDEPATPQRLTALVDLEPELVVIDAAAGAYQIEGYDDNKRADVERFSRLYVGAFWLHGIATIVIDHVVKNTEGRGKFVIGSERKLGSSDVHLGFDTIQPVSRGTQGRYKITTHKDRGGCLKRGHLADLHLDSDPGTHQISWRFVPPTETTSDAGYFRPTHLMERVSVYLELAADPPNRNQIAAALGGRKGYVLKAIDALVIEGFAIEEDGPDRSRLVRSTRRYREEDESANTENGSTMRPEPREPLFSSTTLHESADFAQPRGGSAVPGGSQVVPGTDDVGGSHGSPHLRGEPGHHHHPDRPEADGWFRTNGNLADSYYDQIAPDPDEEH